MSKILPIITLIISINSLVIGQESRFEWNDSTFEIGQIREIQLLFDFDGPCTIQPCYKFAENSSTIDSIIEFMKMNPNIKIEIGVHSDHRGSKKYSLDITSIRAKGIKQEFVFHGIDKERITYVGYGSSKPIISKRKIRKLKTERKKEIAHLKNRRIEIRITDK